MKTLAALLILVVPLLALAQHKCTDADGAVSFQQAPCAAGARSERLALPAARPAAERPEVIRWALANRRLAVGMTRDEVRRVMLASPDRVHVSLVAGGRSEQQVYQRPTTIVYVYFDETDLVSGMQVQER